MVKKKANNTVPAHRPISGTLLHGSAAEGLKHNVPSDDPSQQFYYFVNSIPGFNGLVNRAVPVQPPPTRLFHGAQGFSPCPCDVFEVLRRESGPRFTEFQKVPLRSSSSCGGEIYFIPSKCPVIMLSL